jgi:hypothetical protein
MPMIASQKLFASKAINRHLEAIRSKRHINAQRSQTLLYVGLNPTQEATGPKQMSFAAQFSGTVTGGDQFQATLSQLEIQEV